MNKARKKINKICKEGMNKRGEEEKGRKGIDI